MKKLYFLLLLLASTNTKAQTYAWTKTFGGINYEDGYAVAADGLGNVYLAAVAVSDSVDLDPSSDTLFLRLQHAGGVISILAKYNSSGNLIWAKI